LLLLRAPTFAAETPLKTIKWRVRGAKHFHGFMGAYYLYPSCRQYGDVNHKERPETLQPIVPNLGIRGTPISVVLLCWLHAGALMPVVRQPADARVSRA
jgi:hypothetical protein